MALIITHFALGAGVMVLISHVWFRRHPYRWTVVAASGVWALVPDFDPVTSAYGFGVPRFDSPILGDLFWFHRSLDMLNQGRGSRTVAALSLLFLCAAVVLSELLSASKQ